MSANKPSTWIVDSALVGNQDIGGVSDKICALDFTVSESMDQICSSVSCSLMANLGKQPVKIERAAVVMQISQLLIFISPSLRAIPRWVSGIGKPIRSMCLIKPSSCLIS